MKKSIKTPENNYIKAANVVLNHFKSPLAVVKFVASLISDIDISLQVKSVLNNEPLVNSTDLKWYMTLIQTAFCDIGGLQENQREKGIPKALEWFTERGNSEDIYQALRSAVAHHCIYYADFGVTDLNKFLTDVGVLLDFSVILNNEEKRLLAIKESSKPTTFVNP